MNNRPRLSVKQYLKLMSRLDILIQSVERLDGSDYITTNRGDFFSYLTDLAIFRQCGILELFRQCGILELFRQCGILEWFRQCGILEPHTSNTYP